MTKHNLDHEWLDKLMFLKLGLDLTRKDTQYPLVPSSKLAKFRAAILTELKKAEKRGELKGRIDEHRVVSKRGYSQASLAERFNELLERGRE